MKDSQQVKNYKFARDNIVEVPWVRTKDLAKKKLKHPVVLVNGCFDILHSGHMKLLFCARRQAKTLVLALDSDSRVADLKAGRPILSWVERATQLGFMPIDYLVEVDSDKEFVQLVKAIKPDLRIKGAEYIDVPSRVPDVPVMFVRATGLRTSKIIQRIKDKCLS